MTTKKKNTKTQKMINDILNRQVSYLAEGEHSLNIAYLKDSAYAERTMKRSLRGWIKEYLTIKAKRKVKWRSRKKIDPTGGDLVRIWTEDLKGTSLESDCDFLVWAFPEDTVGRDFSRFLSGL